MNPEKIIRRYFEKQVEGVAIPALSNLSLLIARRNKSRVLRSINALGYVLLALMLIHFF